MCSFNLENLSTFPIRRRYPVVERAVSDVRLLSDPAFAASIRESVNKILMDDRGEGGDCVGLVEHKQRSGDATHALGTHGELYRHIHGSSRY